MLVFIGFVACKSTYGQIRTNLVPASTIGNQSAFLDAGGSTFNSSTNNGKGLAFPRTNLTTFQFVADGSAFSFPTRYDGMIVYNTATGTTPAAGSGVRSGIGSQAVIPGFYYFSNPTAASVVGNGQWLPLGGSSVKSKTVTGVVADGVAATLDLGTAVIAANEVVELVGAKVYNAAGDLVIGAFSEYTKATNILATGNGMMYQVLPAGTYKVVVDYK